MNRRVFTASFDGVERASVTVTVRLSREMLRQVAAASQADGQSEKSFLVHALFVGLQAELNRVEVDQKMLAETRGDT